MIFTIHHFYFLFCLGHDRLWIRSPYLSLADKWISKRSWELLFHCHLNYLWVLMIFLFVICWYDIWWFSAFRCPKSVACCQCIFHKKWNVFLFYGHLNTTFIISILAFIWLAFCCRSCLLRHFSFVLATISKIIPLSQDVIWVRHVYFPGRQHTLLQNAGHH